MKKYLFTMIVGLFILMPINAKALLCRNDDKVKYQEMAQNISIGYDYSEVNDDAIFNIKLSNIPEGFIILDIVNEKKYEYSSSELVIQNVNKNSNYKFNVYTNDYTCKYEVLYTHYITIPGYNKFYKDELCQGIEDYKLCSKWLNTTMTYEEWKIKVNEYRSNSDDNKQNEEEKDIKGIFDIILDFYLEYYMYILPVVIIGSIVTAYFYNKKDDLF